MTADRLIEPQAASDAQRALDQHGVVVYREINISDEQLLAFSRLLGKLVVQPTGEHRYPEIQTITLDPAKTNALLASYRQGNFHWHIDGAIDEYPAKGNASDRARSRPSRWGHQFANTYAAYAGLTDDERAEIADLRVVHSFARAQSLANPDATEDQRRSSGRAPVRVHPLVWTRANGRRSLLLGATAAEIVGWPATKGRALLDRLLDWST